MAEYRFFHPVDVRYADIDAQRHVNNVVFFTYMETARAQYLQHLGLWDGQDFADIGIILVQAECQYLRPIAYKTRVRVGVRTEAIGNKSMTLSYCLEDADQDVLYGEGRTVLVAYDYRTQCSLTVPERWRHVIISYEQPGSVSSPNEA
jgi:acyl-CoA thioester hydrolase